MDKQIKMSAENIWNLNMTIAKLEYKSIHIDPKFRVDNEYAKQKYLEIVGQQNQYINTVRKLDREYLDNKSQEEFAKKFK